MTVVTHDGTVVRFSEATHGPEVMNSVRCCLGTIGLIYDITLRVEPLSRQVAVDRRLPMAVAEDPAQLASLLSGNEYTEVFWFPTSGGLWFKSWSSTSDPVPRVRLARAPLSLAPRTLASTLIGNTTGRHVMQRLPGMTPVVNKLLYRGTFPSSVPARTGPSTSSIFPASSPIFAGREPDRVRDDTRRPGPRPGVHEPRADEDLLR